MAIRDDNTPPSKPGSITQTADSQIDRVGNISNVSKTVSNMQKDVKQKITETKEMVDSNKEISAIQSSMVKVLEKLEQTIGALSSGVKTVTVDTAKATKDAIADYSKAISQDISFNKQNVIAMALAKSTPIYGYFVAKFMETDVFKRAAERMKRSISRTFGSLAGVFRRGSKEPGSRTKIPHMQKGGIVKKEGVAKLHAAEVVMPVEKLLEKIDDSNKVSKNIVGILNKVSLQQATSAHAMKSFIAHPEDFAFAKGKKRNTLIQDIFKYWRKSKEHYKDPIDVQILRAVLAIKESMKAEFDKFGEFISNVMARHPAFRNLAALGGTLKNLTKFFIFKPGYALFRKRGGYDRMLSKARQPFTAMNQNIGTHFVESMWRFDNMLNLLRAIAEATRDTASAFTGKKYSSVKGVGTGRWSVAGRLARLAGRAAGFGMRAVGKIPKLGWAGTAGRKTTDLMTRFALGKSAREYALEESQGAGGGIGSLKYPMIVKDLTIDNIRKPFEFYYSIFHDKYKKEQKDQKLLVESAVEQTKTLKVVKKKLKDQWWMKILIMAGGFLKTMWNATLGKLFKFAKAKLITPLLSGGLSGLFGGGKLGPLPPGMGKVAGYGAMAASVGLAVYDAINAVALSDKWKTSKTAAGIGGFLGGTGKGWGNAAMGVAKGAGIGALIGSAVPVIGTAIGGAVGAIAGGILGFVGGKNIAKGLDAMAGHIKKLARATWSIISLPYVYIKETWNRLKDGITWKDIKEQAKSTLTLLWKMLTWPYQLYKAIKKEYTHPLVRKVEEVKEKVKEFVEEPFDTITELGAGIKDWIADRFDVGKYYDKVAGVISWPFTKIKDIATNIYDSIFEKLNIEEYKDDVTKFISWPITKIGEIKDKVVGWVTENNFISSSFERVSELIEKPLNYINDIKDKVISWFTETPVGQKAFEQAKNMITMPVDKLISIKDNVLEKTTNLFGNVTEWVSDVMNIKSVKAIINDPLDGLMNMFSWVGDIFTDISNWVVDNISKIPGASFFMKDKKKPSARSGKTITEKAKEAYDKTTNFLFSDEPSKIAEKARISAATAMQKAKTTGTELYSKLSPEARKAFENAKQYYMKNFGWTESQADAVLQTLAATAGDKLDIFKNPEKMKAVLGNLTGTATGAIGGIKEKFSAIFDTGQIVVNEAHLMLANGEMIVDDLGKKIMESSEELGKKTIQGAGYVANTVNNVTQSVMNTSSNNTTAGGGNRGSSSDSRTFFDNLVYTGNYR